MNKKEAVRVRLCTRILGDCLAVIKSERQGDKKVKIPRALDGDIRRVIKILDQIMPKRQTKND